MIRSFIELCATPSDLSDALNLLTGKITINDRFYLVKNKIKIFISKNQKSCVFRYKQDKVPLFVFTDTYSVNVITAALKNGESND